MANNGLDNKFLNSDSSNKFLKNTSLSPKKLSGSTPGRDSRGGLSPETLVDSTPTKPRKGGLSPETLVDSTPTKPRKGGLSPETLVDSTPTKPRKGGLSPETLVDSTPTKPRKGGLSPETLVDSTPAKPRKGGLSPETLVDSTSTGHRSHDGSLQDMAADMLDPKNVMNRATANAFSSIDAFKNAVEHLPQLIGVSKKTYAVKKTISREGGESVVLLCSDPDGRDVVAKIYYEPVNGHGSSISARVRVLEYMATEEGKKYTLAASDIGLVELSGSRYYFEIMPYCKDGDLTHAKAMTFDQIVSLADYLNEALHSMHRAGILHRDIKPANLYRLDGRIVIGDFGVAKLANAGATTIGVGTEGYRAPETLYAVSRNNAAYYFTEKSDYYSLGITLGTLYEGRFVYQDLDAAMITVTVQQGRVPLTKNDPQRPLLENLLRGLCTFDPNKRFGHEDVRRWITDHNYSGGASDDSWPKAFRMNGKEYRDERSLFEGITADAASWNEGRDLLYNKFFENFFMSFRTDLARAAQLADESWRTKDRDKGLAIFLKTLFPAGPIVWKGYTFRSLQELADKMAVTKTPAGYGEMLQKKCISHWLTNTTGIKADPANLALVESMERQSLQEPEIACYWFGNSFARQKELTVCGRKVQNLSQLLQAMFQSPRDFYLQNGYDMLMDRTVGAALYGFLFSFGYRQVAEDHWKQVRSCDEYHKACILLGMLDTIAEKAKADPKYLRKFFVSYGPVGIYTYTQKLLSQNSGKVYEPLDAEGSRILAQIRDFRPSSAASVDELYRAFQPLQDLVVQMQRVLTDNPFCICTGTYEHKGILCKNLTGTFGFRIFGIQAPLGFHAWIEASQGGGKK